MAFEVVSEPVEGGFIPFLQQKILAVHGIQAAVIRAEEVSQTIASAKFWEGDPTLSTMYVAHEGSVFCTYTLGESVKEGEYSDDENADGGFTVLNEHEIELPVGTAGRGYQSKRLAVRDGQVYALTSDGRYRIIPIENFERDGGGIMYQPGSNEGMLYDPVTGDYLFMIAAR